jgi:phage shock protein A
MSVFSRFADIINANINAILDQAEDPEKMVVLITREMEETLVEVRSTTARYIADKKEIRKRIAWLEQEGKIWEEKAELAISKGRDDLARAALREKGIVTEAAVALKSDLVHIDDNLCKLQSDTQRLQEKLQEARVRQDALIMRGKTASSRLQVKRHLHDTNIDDALARFDGYERKLDDLEGQVESYDLGQQTLSDEIAALDNGEHLDRELAALKSKIQQRQSIN